MVKAYSKWMRSCLFMAIMVWHVDVIATQIEHSLVRMVPGDRLALALDLVAQYKTGSDGTKNTIVVDASQRERMRWLHDALDGINERQQLQEQVGVFGAIIALSKDSLRVQRVCFSKALLLEWRQLLALDRLN